MSRNISRLMTNVWSTGAITSPSEQISAFWTTICMFWWIIRVLYFIITRQIIRCRIISTLQRPISKLYTTADEVGVNKTNVYPTAVLENYSSSGILILLIKVQKVCIQSNNFACKFTHIIMEKRIVREDQKERYHLLCIAGGPDVPRLN